MKMSLLPARCRLALLSSVSVLSSTSALSADDGLVTVTLAVPKDSGAARAAVLSAPALRDAFAGDARFTLADL